MNSLIFLKEIILLMTFMAKQTRIWIQGETTSPFVCPEVSFSKQKRFKLHSIYWPDKSPTRILVKNNRSLIDEEAYRISKVIDEEERNYLRMNRTGLTSRNKSQRKVNNMKIQKRSSPFKFERATSLSEDNERIVERLAKTCDFKQSLLRDRHGNRTSILENQEDEFYNRIKEGKKFISTQRGFYTSRRINLNLPHNYYPGPGTYDIKRYLESKTKDQSKFDGSSQA